MKDAAGIGFDNEFLYRQLRRPAQEREIPEVRLLAEEARRVFDD